MSVCSQECTTRWTFVGVNDEQGDGGTAVEDREEGGEMVKLPDKGRVWKRRWLSLLRRGDERWTLLLFALNFFFFSSPRCLPPSTPSLSLLLVQKALWAPAVSQSAGLLRQSSTWFSMITVIVCAPVHAACRLDVRLMRGRRRGGNGAKTGKSYVTSDDASLLKLTSFSASKYIIIHHR